MLVNAQGLNEPGIDGGGVFREFLSDLLKTGFDPNHGYFTTAQEGQLYPNPQVCVYVCMCLCVHACLCECINVCTMPVLCTCIIIVQRVTLIPWLS